MKIEIKYTIGEFVALKEIEIVGRVVEILYKTADIQYKVVYWYDGNRKEIWVYDWEITKKE